MKRPGNVKQFDGFRKNKWQSLTLQIPTLISLCLGHPSTALSATTAPFSYEIARAENLNTVFNNLFQYHLNNSPGSYEKDASKYLLSLPPLAKESPLNQNYKCSANISAEFCRLQQNFLNLTPSSFSEALIKDPQTPRVGDNTIQSILEQTITPSLNKNDTMVVVIPGIFGEFINQTAFGEIFGEGEATRNLETTNFSKEFKNSLEKCGKDPSAPSPCYDGRFSLSRWVPSSDGSASINFNDSTQIQNELINEWIKVASVDSPSHDKTLFKVVVLKLKAMSMESMGNQSILADIYLRRFNKFMEFYTNIMKQKTPSRIIFVGYSRGAPIGYEMLTKLNSNEAKYNQYKNSEWAQNIAAMVSVAGVIFGSSLADATVVGENARDWNKTPVKTKMIQAFSLLANKFTPLPHDKDQLKQSQQNGTLNKIVTANTHILDILNEKIQSFRQQLNEEIKTINQGELEPNEASDLTKVDVLTSQMELARKALGYAYNLADDKSILEEKLSSIKGVKNIASQINWAGVKAKVLNLSTISSSATNSELKQIGLELYTVLNKYMQLQKDSKTLEIFSSLSAGLQEGLKASKSLASKDFSEMESGKLLKMFRDLLALTKEFKPEELFLKRQGSSLASNVPAASFQEILSRLTLGWKNKFTALRESLPDSQAALALNAQLMKNWGADESLQRIKTAAFHDKGELSAAILKEYHLNLAKFFFYFNRAWEGASEIGTSARIEWWKTKGPLLPSKIKYYTIGGVLDQPDQTFYQKGIGFGWRQNTLDDRFLVFNHRELSNVGKTDGLPLEFAGSHINDSQVDLYKTYLWPSVARELTNGHCFDSKFIGVARTHHWGLTLPYAFVNVDAQKKPISNPFPRDVLLHTLVDAITHDLATTENICSSPNLNSNSN